MSRSFSFFEVRDALGEPGCPVCRLKLKYVVQFIDGVLYEKVNDPGLREKIRAARGFCNEHGWAFVREAAALGVAIITRDVLRQVLSLLPEAPGEDASGVSGWLEGVLGAKTPVSDARRLSAALAPQQPCVVCTMSEIFETHCVKALNENLLGESGLLAAYRDSDGLCLPHFRQALEQIDSQETFSALVAAQRGIWQTLEGQLSEIIRKEDYRFRDEPSGDEAGAWLRALAALVGEERDYTRT